MHFNSSWCDYKSANKRSWLCLFTISIPLGAIIRVNVQISNYAEQNFNSSWCDYKLEVACAHKVSVMISIPLGAIISFVEYFTIFVAEISIPLGAIIRLANTSQNCNNNKFQFLLVRL